MPFMQVPANVTSITINAVAKVPDGNREISVTQAEANDLCPIQNQPQVVIAAANGDVTIKLPPAVTAATIGGVGYVVDGSNQIVVPAAAATAFMSRLKGQPLSYSRA